MKHLNTIYFLLPIFLNITLFFPSCKGSESSFIDKEDTIPVVNIKPIMDLQAVKTQYANELQVSWTNPDDENLYKIELSYDIQSTEAHARSSSASKQEIKVSRGTQCNILLKLPTYGRYRISAVAISRGGERSETVAITAFPSAPTKDEIHSNIFMNRADTLMTSMMSLFFGKSSHDCWNSNYPNSTGPYWDGDAVVWGQGAGFAGFVAIREASSKVKKYADKYIGLTDRMFNSINRYITTDNNIQAYAVYPANGNERYYDDNVWIGLEMADLYVQTQDSKFLDKAVMVWNYLMKGYDNTCGGGIYWREIPATTSKHTCSTAPTTVLACKLYNITKDDKYLRIAKELYKWLQSHLQDPTDFLYWDNIHPDMSVEKTKYSYNSGQPMQAACLLYKITGDETFLEDAQKIANSAYKKWFTPFNSSALGETFNILKPGHIWFQAILLRGFIELYKIDHNQEYVTAYEKTLTNAWLTACRNKGINLLNTDFRGIDTQTKWEILYEGACVEMLARLASLESNKL